MTSNASAHHALRAGRWCLALVIAVALFSAGYAVRAGAFAFVVGETTDSPSADHETRVHCTRYSDSGVPCLE